MSKTKTKPQKKPPTTTPDPVPGEVRLDDLRLDERLQPRVRLDQAVVDDYAAAYQRKDPMPPIRVWILRRLYQTPDIDTPVLTRGFTRVAAAKQAGLKTLPAEIIICTDPVDEDLTTLPKGLLLDSLSGNATNGQRLTNADKKRAVELYHQLTPKSAWGSLRTVAALIGCSHEFIAQYRKPKPETPEKTAQPSSDDNDQPTIEAMTCLAQEIAATKPTEAGSEVEIIAAPRINLRLIFYPEKDAVRCCLGWTYKHNVNGRGHSDQTIGGSTTSTAACALTGLTDTIRQDQDHPLRRWLVGLDLLIQALEGLTTPDHQPCGTCPPACDIGTCPQDKPLPEYEQGYAQGVKDREAGITVPKNPWRIGTWPAIHWAKGWHDATDADDQADQPSDEDLFGDPPVVITTPGDPLALRRMARERELLADAIEAEPGRWNTSQASLSHRDWCLLVLIVGLDSQPAATWSDTWRASALTHLDEAFAKRLAAELRRGNPKLPDTALLARLYGHDADSLRIQAERAIRE